MVRDAIRAEIQAVYDAVGRSGSLAPPGLGMATGRGLAHALGYQEADLAQVPGQVVDASVGAAALADLVSGNPP